MATTVRRQTKHVYIGVCAPTIRHVVCHRVATLFPRVDAVFTPVGVKLGNCDTSARRLVAILAAAVK